MLLNEKQAWRPSVGMVPAQVVSAISPHANEPGASWECAAVATGLPCGGQGLQHGRGIRPIIPSTAITARRALHGLGQRATTAYGDLLTGYVAREFAHADMLQMAVWTISAVNNSNVSTSPNQRRVAYEREDTSAALAGAQAELKTHVADQ